MRIHELLVELSFQGSLCTKDCSGHAAGYQWAMKNQKAPMGASTSPSFNSGSAVATRQLQTGKTIRPKIRNAQGKFAAGPNSVKRPVAATLPKPLTPAIKSV